MKHVEEAVDRGLAQGSSKVVLVVSIRQGNLVTGKRVAESNGLGADSITISRLTDEGSIETEEGAVPLVERLLSERQVKVEVAEDLGELVIEKHGVDHVLHVTREELLADLVQVSEQIMLQSAAELLQNPDDGTIAGDVQC